MKDLTIIEGQSEKFVLVDQENDNYGLKAYYVNLSNYNEGFFNDEDLKKVEVEFSAQRSSSIRGWFNNDYDAPNFEDINAYPGDDSYDYTLAIQTALEVANEQVLQLFDINENVCMTQ